MSAAPKRGLADLLIAIFLAVAPLPAAAGEVAPADAGVQVEKRAGDGIHFQQGSGIYLGRGLILTADHVVRSADPSADVTVLLDGRLFEGKVVLSGHADNPADNIDLALIRLAPEALSAKRLAQPTVSVCTSNPPPSRPVSVVALGKVSASSTISTPITSDGKTGTWTDLLADPFHRGNSGGGVFDAGRGCLWGVIRLEMSGKSVTDGHFIDITAFVPASGILAFLAKYRGDPQDVDWSAPR